MKEPHINEDYDAEKCLKEMININMSLYDQCLSTVGFAFCFSQLVNRAVSYDALKAKCDAYEQALEVIVSTDVALDMEITEKLESIAREVLAKYKEDK